MLAIGNFFFFFENKWEKRGKLNFYEGKQHFIVWGVWLPPLPPLPNKQCHIPWNILLQNFLQEVYGGPYETLYHEE